MIHDGSHTLHHALDRGAVGDVGDDAFLVRRGIGDRPVVGQAQMAPLGAQSVAQRGADRAGGAGDQDAISGGIDHGKELQCI